MAWQKLSNIKGDPGPVGPPGSDAAVVTAALVGAGADQDLTGSGNQTINLPYGGVTAITLTGNMTLTIKCPDRMSVALYVTGATANGYTLTINGFDNTVTSDGLVALTLVNGSWHGGAGAPVIKDLTAADVTFADDSVNGGGSYVIPTSNGITYYNGSLALTAGTYPVNGTNSTQAITITAQVNNSNTTEIAATSNSSWTHTFPKSTFTLIGDQTFTSIADNTALSTLSFPNGTAYSISAGTPVVYKGAIVAAANGATGNGSFALDIPLVKRRTTFTYDLGDNQDTFNQNKLWFGPGDGPNADYGVMWTINSTGGIGFNPFNAKYTWTASGSYSTFVAPNTGTAQLLMDKAAGTFTLTINGTLVGTATMTPTADSMKEVSKGVSCYIYQNAAAKSRPMAVKEIKIEALS